MTPNNNSLALARTRPSRARSRGAPNTCASYEHSCTFKNRTTRYGHDLLSVCLPGGAMKTCVCCGGGGRGVLSLASTTCFGRPKRKIVSLRTAKEPKTFLEVCVRMRALARVRVLCIQEETNLRNYLPHERRLSQVVRLYEVCMYDRTRYFSADFF